jgi:hypothetical protein
MLPSPEADMVIFYGNCTLDSALRKFPRWERWNNGISDIFSPIGPRHDHAASSCDSQAEPKNPDEIGKVSETLIIRQNNMLEE